MSERETISSLIDDLIDTLETDKADILSSSYPDDRIWEYVDGAVPIYTSDLMQLAADDISLATEEPHIGPAFDGSPTPVNIVAANVFERLLDAANKWLADAQDDDEEDDDV